MGGRMFDYLGCFQIVGRMVQSACYINESHDDNEYHKVWMKGVKRSYLEHNLVGGIPWFVMKVIYRIGDLRARTDDRSGSIA